MLMKNDRKGNENSMVLIRSESMWSLFRITFSSTRFNFLTQKYQFQSMTMPRFLRKFVLFFLFLNVQGVAWTSSWTPKLFGMPVAVSGRSKRQVSSRVESTSSLAPFWFYQKSTKNNSTDMSIVSTVSTVLEEAQQWNLCPGSSLSTKHGFWTKPWWNWNSCAFVHLYRPYLFKRVPSFLLADFLRWFQVIKSRSQVSPLLHRKVKTLIHRAPLAESFVSCYSEIRRWYRSWRRKNRQKKRKNPRCRNRLIQRHYMICFWCCCFFLGGDGARALFSLYTWFFGLSWFLRTMLDMIPLKNPGICVSLRCPTVWCNIVIVGSWVDDRHIIFICGIFVISAHYTQYGCSLKGMVVKVWSMVLFV